MVKKVVKMSKYKDYNIERVHNEGHGNQVSILRVVEIWIRIGRRGV
jgi:hypothetical protein